MTLKIVYSLNLRIMSTECLASDGISNGLVYSSIFRKLPFIDILVGSVRSLD